LMLLKMVAHLHVAVAGVYYAHVVEHASIFHAAVRRLDESVIVDARIAAQRGDQSDVRAFRRFNRANAAIVRGVNVADFKSRALTRKTARVKGRETPLVRDLGE